MSGLVGIIGPLGGTSEPHVFERLLRSLEFRGPDGTGARSSGPAQFGCTRLKVDRRNGESSRPTTDHGTMAIADARIDDRMRIVAELGSSGVACATDAADVELITAAWRSWGPACVDHLLGDFSFAIWEEATQTLFAARDHFGVKPFFYSVKIDPKLGQPVLVFSNTIDTIRQHPLVGNDLDETNIADLLLFGGPREPHRTSFIDIHRLPAGHLMTWRKGELSIRRYWELPTDGCIRFRNDQECVERFRDLMEAAVADRTHTDRVVISLSGGVDSCLVAAMTDRVRTRYRETKQLTAVTVDWSRRIVNDNEFRHAEIAARSLGIDLTAIDCQRHHAFQGYRQGLLRSPEPCDSTFPSLQNETNCAASAMGRVLLTGQGGDALFRASADHFLATLSSGAFLRAFAETGTYLLSTGRLPPLSLRSRFKRMLGKGKAVPDLPKWLAPEFVRRCDLKERWEAARAESPPKHPIRPEAWNLLQLPFWAFLFERYDAGTTGCRMEVRHPLFDLRVVEFLLALPPMPWFAEKDLARRAMADRLPPAITRRRKKVLGGSARAYMAGSDVVRQFCEAAARRDLPEFFVGRILAEHLPGPYHWETAQVVSLFLWLRQFENQAESFLVGD